VNIVDDLLGFFPPWRAIRGGVWFKSRFGWIRV
jgi:hypothetical protein